MEDTLCTGCLCSGRKLNLIGETGFYQLYSQILNEIPVQDMSQVCIRICWECCALLHKFQLFKAQVKQNYMDMLWNTPPAHPTRLTTTRVYNISYPDQELQVKDEDPVKDEYTIPEEIKTEDDMEWDMESAELMEPVTFITDLLVEREVNKPTKKSKRKPKEKKPSKINVKKKKKTKEPVLSDGVSDTDLPEDDVLEDVEDKAEEKTKDEKKKMEVDILVEKPTDNTPPAHPTRLTTTRVYNISYPDQELQVKDEDPVKDEYTIPEEIKTEDDMEWSAEHMEPVTFVTDLLVEREVNKPTKKSKRKPKEKKPSKINVKKKKNTKEPVLSDGDSDTDLPEDDVLEDVEDKAEEKSKDEKKKTKVSRSKYDIPQHWLPLPGPLPKMLKTPVVKPPVVKPPVVKPPVVKPPVVKPLPEKPECAECGKTFSSRKTYRYHFSVLHKGHNHFPCPTCGKIYQWKSNLGRHMRTHKAVDAGELYCDTCDKSFASVATYRQHLRLSRRHVTENEFGYTCNECGKKFVNKTRLQDHIDWEHLKKIKFRCQLCNKPFRCYMSMYNHLQNVHRDKDNLCHVCGKAYQNAAKLKNHITAMHTGETPYHCSQCTAAFGWKTVLCRHVREVHYKVKKQPKKTKKSKKLDSEPPV